MRNTKALRFLATLALPAAIIAAAARGESASHRADWTSYGGMNEDHYSPLDQINDKNVGRLGLAWSFDIDPVITSFTAPVEADGVVYFAVGHSILRALDAKSGKLLWQYDPEVYKVAGHKLRAGWGIRGIAYSNGKVFTGTLDGRLIALDAKTGQVAWSAMTMNPDDELYIAGPPWVMKDKVIIGNGGSDYGANRGYVTAYDAKSGKQLWRFYTVPGDPAKGFENAAMAKAAKTWTGEWWKFGGGGNVWHAMAYDPKFNRIYLGTGNGSPWNPKVRSPGGGDNLFICSIVALDADTGKYVWHYQVNPADGWDYDADLDIEFADLRIGGQARPVILHAAKNGFFYVIDRANGELLSAEKFAKANWAERIDLKTGRPVENPEARYPAGQAFLAYPWVQGAHGVQAMAFSPKTNLAYIPAMEGGRVYTDPPGNLADWKPKSGMFTSTALGAPPASIKVPPPTSSLLAWDPVRQKAAWTVPLSGALNGGVMATGGNLVVQGHNTGEIAIYAADTGAKLWAFDGQDGILGQPISYMVDGKQYITIVTGWRSSYSSVPNWDYYAQKRRVLTFALDGQAKLPPTVMAETPILDDPTFVIDPKKAEIGSAVFTARCTICHGAGMISGGAAPDLRKAAAPTSIDALTAILHDGVLQQKGMPRFEELSIAEIEGLQHFIRQRARETMTATK